MGIRPPDVDDPPDPGLLPEPDHFKSPDRLSMWDRFPHLGHLNHRIHGLFGRDSSRQSPISVPATRVAPCASTQPQPQGLRREESIRPVGVSLPRQPTFRRQNSEKRERLVPYEPCAAERRAMSMSRQTSLSVAPARSKSSPPPERLARSSAPAVPQTTEFDLAPPRQDRIVGLDYEIPHIDLDEVSNGLNDALPRARRPPSRTSSDDSIRDRFPELDERAQINAELDSKWILNLSMHFRDRSEREKFFVTYAETPSRWRRVTISCDYRHAEPGSLEMDLKELRFQRDKNFHIYESIRDSLPDIQFFDTVTNLKLETSDGRLHVHVTEDVNESIPYPQKSTVAHILEDDDFRPMEVLESELSFESHLSGFVYKVTYQGRTYIKKEIPGPDTVDEFLYEVNALHALHGSKYVIQLEAIVLDDSGELVKGLLIGFAERGAVVDLLYDHKGEIPWDDRVRWAEQAVHGLSEIHAEGYVQGDFTLSNIVVDGDNNARIIDINRRGCPVGWEPPEIAKKIQSSQRISMYIGEKSDVYQLGMSLWALAMDDDEPERHDPPLSTDAFPSEVDEWYQEIVRNCLEEQPRNRLSAKELLPLFRNTEPRQARAFAEPRPIFVNRESREFIDPANAVERDDLERFRSDPPEPKADDLAYTPASSFDDWTYTFPKSSNYEYGDSTMSELERPRGRRYLRPSEQHDPASPKAAAGASSTHDDDGSEPQIISIAPGAEPEYEEIEFDGHRFLYSTHGLEHSGLGINAQPQPPQPKPASMQATYQDDHSSSPLPQSEDEIDLDGPHQQVRPEDAAATTSSESTPRNANSVVASINSISSTLPTSLALDLSGVANADLAGLGSHPELGQWSPHEPKVFADQAVEASGLTEIEPVAAKRAMPSMPFQDSGYAESAHLAQHSSEEGYEAAGKALTTTPEPAVGAIELPTSDEQLDESQLEALPPLPPSPMHETIQETIPG